MNFWYTLNLHICKKNNNMQKYEKDYWIVYKFNLKNKKPQFWALKAP